jgi:hypothetical protein
MLVILAGCFGQMLGQTRAIFFCEKFSLVDEWYKIVYNNVGCSCWLFCTGDGANVHHFFS